MYPLRTQRTDLMRDESRIVRLTSHSPVLHDPPRYIADGVRVNLSLPFS